MGLDYKIDYEIAEEEFEKICDDWEIDIDETGMNEDEKVDFDSIKRKIIKAIRLKRLEYNEDETISYTISKKSKDQAGEILIIQRPKGEANLSMDQFKRDKDGHKTFSYLSAMVGKPIQYLSKLDGIDIKVFLAFVQLFLAD